MDEQKPKPRIESFDHLESAYANNSRFETSVWDLKILFGQLEQHSGSAVIDWHTAVTIPWMHAKVLIYFMRVNMVFHELGPSGTIKVHPNVKPPKPVPPSEQEKKDTPGAEEIYKAITKLHAEMFGES
jgi:hypothetical protein